MTIQSKTVATPSAAAASNVANASLARTLMGDTAAMRAARKTYLPKNEAESEDAYNVRLQRSVLFNAFGKTVEDMTGKVFAKPVVIKDDVPAQIQAFAEDIDLTGRHLNVFARDVFHDAMQPGVSFILTDQPPAPQRADGQPATLADEQKAGVRPYLVHIPVERMLGWISQVIGGVETILQVRILECVTERDGDFHETEVQQIRVIDAGTPKCTWRTFRRSESDKETWIENAAGVTALPFITLVAVYTKRTGFMTGSPPLGKLADLNVAHWQLDSDLGNITHVAQVPILHFAGFAEGDKFAIGTADAIRSSEPTAKVVYVEHTGKAIESGRQRLKDIEFQMQTMGLSLLVDKPGQTATGEVRDDVKENSPLAMMAANLQDALEISLGFMAQYMGLGDDAGGSLDVNKDFGVMAQRNDLQQLAAVRAQGDISRETLWEEMQRRNYLSEDFDPDAEKDRLANEPLPGLTDPTKPFTPGA